MYVCIYMYVCMYAYISMSALLYAYIYACIIRGSGLCVIRYPFTVKDPVLLITGGPAGPARGRDALWRGAELLHGAGAGARPGGA